MYIHFRCYFVNNVRLRLRDFGFCYFITVTLRDYSFYLNIAIRLYYVVFA